MLSSSLCSSLSRTAARLLRLVILPALTIVSVFAVILVCVLLAIGIPGPVGAHAMGGSGNPDRGEIINIKLILGFSRFLIRVMFLA